MVWARRLATRLQRLGVRRGDRVALYLANSPALVASYFAAWLLGATAVPSDSMASELELARQVADAQASILLAAGDNVPIAASVAVRQAIPLLSDLQPDDAPLREPAPINPHQDLALLIYTGGTAERVYPRARRLPPIAGGSTCSVERRDAAHLAQSP